MQITPGSVHPLSRGTLSQLPLSALAEQAQRCPASDQQGLEVLDRLEGSSASNALEFYQRTQQAMAANRKAQQKLESQIDLTTGALNTGARVGGAGLGLAVTVGSATVASVTSSETLGILSAVTFVGGLFATVLLPLFAADSYQAEPLPFQDKRRQHLNQESAQLSHTLKQVGPLASQVLEQGTQAELWQEPLQEAIQDYQVEVLGSRVPVPQQAPNSELQASDLKALSKSELIQASARLDLSQHWGIPFDQPLLSSQASLAQLSGSDGYTMLKSASPEQREALLQSARLAELPQRLPAAASPVDVKQITGKANDFAREVWSQLNGD